MRFSVFDEWIKKGPLHEMILVIRIGITEESLFFLFQDFQTLEANSIREHPVYHET